MIRSAVGNSSDFGWARDIRLTLDVALREWLCHLQFTAFEAWNYIDTVGDWPGPLGAFSNYESSGQGKPEQDHGIVEQSHLTFGPAGK